MSTGVTGDRLTARPRLVVPAYFHPGVHPDMWEELVAHAGQLRLVVLNPASGPGTHVDGAFLPWVARLRRAGVAVGGYVDTDYGRRGLSEVLVDLARHMDWYGLDGVVFDRAASGHGELDYYARLADAARALGVREVTFNHGTVPLHDYARYGDLLGTFEGPWRAYREVAVPRWMRAMPAAKFYHLIYAVPRGHLAETLELAARRHVGGVYVTDLGSANPWRALPGHLST